MKIGIMSFAHMHAFSYANSLQQLPNVELVAIFDDNQERGKEAATKYDCEYFSDSAAFLTQDLDAVIICSENNRHKEMVVQAAKAKKHILCEKPIATSLEDAKEMIEVCETEEVILQVAYPVRFCTPIQELKRMVDAGDFGEILAFRTTNRGQNPGGWFIDKEQSGGGSVLDHTVHMVDIMRWLLGEEVVEVNAIVDSYFQNIELDDAGLLTLEFENGVVASHDSSWSKFDGYPTWGDITIEVIGTKKSLKVDGAGEYLNVFNKKGKPLEFVSYGKDMDFGLVRDFVDCVETGREPFITGYDGLKTLEVSLAAYQASESGETVYLGKEE